MLFRSPQAEAKPVLQRLEFTINGMLITPDVCIEVSIRNSDAILDQLEVVLGVHNPGDTIANWWDWPLGLILPEHLPPIHSGVQLQDKRFLHDLGTIGRLLPDQWDKVRLTLSLHAVAHCRGQEIQAELKVFTFLGPLSTVFSLKFV